MLLLLLLLLLLLCVCVFEKSDEDDDEADAKVQRVSDEAVDSESLLSLYIIAVDNVGDDAPVGCDDDDVSMGILTPEE